MAYKDPEKEQKYQEEYRAKNKDKINEKNKEYYQKIKEKNNEYCEKRRKVLKQNVYDSITSKKIIDRKKWDQWCNVIKSNAKTNKHPYSDDFTDDIIFGMLIKGCFYCGDIATTIDRVDSTLDHTIGNCVGCCYGCNTSKGVADPSTFIRKAYYRVFEEYVDEDTDIWYVHKQKPYMCHYKNKSEKKEVPFELTKDEWDTLVKGDCNYCGRSPTTWFGVDRKVPSLGYILENVVSCCFDCNVDKLDDNIESMKTRNERIANRVITDELSIIECEKVILHSGKKHES